MIGLGEVSSGCLIQTHLAHGAVSMVVHQSEACGLHVDLIIFSSSLVFDPWA